MSRSDFEAAAEVAGIRLRSAASPDALSLATFPGCPRPVPVGDVWGVHDGAVEVALPERNMRLLSLSEAQETHREMLAMVIEEDLVGEGVASDGSRGEVFTAGWIPIAGEDESLLCIDLDPEDPSKVGQIIEVHTTEGLHGKFADDLSALFKYAARSL